MTLISHLRRVLQLRQRRGKHYVDPAEGGPTRALLDRVRADVWDLGWGETAAVDSLRVKVTDGPNFYMQYKDVFVHRIYQFTPSRPDPLIIDGGANIGMAALYFKRTHPRARIVAFEPDPQIHELLEDNLAAGRAGDVECVRAGLGGKTGRFEFLADNSAGGQITASPSPHGVEVARLSDYIIEPVDFLKLNIEGFELDVLEEAEAAGKLGKIREMVVEYHGWPGQPQRLGKLLELLERGGFRYLVHDFDSETCRATKPPFELKADTTWFCLVHARRADTLAAPKGN